MDVSEVAVYRHNRSSVASWTFAMHAAAALGQAQHVGQLHQAMGRRDVIGQAKGMLMERFGIDAEQAFSLLARSSQETNMKLVAVARWLTSSA